LLAGVQRAGQVDDRVAASAGSSRRFGIAQAELDHIVAPRAQRRDEPLADEAARAENGYAHGRPNLAGAPDGASNR
jgi:hypothetical protein